MLLRQLMVVSRRCSRLNRQHCGLLLSSRRFISAGKQISSERPASPSELVRPILFTAFVSVGGCTCAAISKSRNATSFQGSAQVKEYRSIRWLRLLSQYNPFLGSLTNTIEKVWNERAITAFAPIFLVNLAVFFGWRLGYGTSSIRNILEKYFLLRPQYGNVVPSSVLLSSFSHMGTLHFAFNMYAVWSFINALPEFCDEDLWAWYCSAGAISGLTSLTASVAFRRCIPSLGASGAAFFLASWLAWSQPDAQFGIIFIPNWSTDGQTLMTAIMGFDLLGFMLRWRSLDHAAHLGGAVLGNLCSRTSISGLSPDKWNPLRYYLRYQHWLMQKLVS